MRGKQAAAQCEGMYSMWGWFPTEHEHAFWLATTTNLSSVLNDRRKLISTDQVGLCVCVQQWKRIHWSCCTFCFLSYISCFILWQPPTLLKNPRWYVCKCQGLEPFVYLGKRCMNAGRVTTSKLLLLLKCRIAVAGFDLIRFDKDNAAFPSARCCERSPAPYRERSDVKQSFHVSVWPHFFKPWCSFWSNCMYECAF